MPPDDTLTAAPPAPSRSIFVDVVGFGFLLIAAFYTLLSGAHLVMLMRLPGVFGIWPIPAAPDVMVAFVVGQLLTIAPFAWSVATLAAAIGLLRRKDWARRLFVGLLCAAIVWTLWLLVARFVSQAGVSPDTANMRAFALSGDVFAVAKALIIGALFGWSAKRLLSPRIAAGFPPSPAHRIARPSPQRP
ncbi:hypothetical protein [Coralloluteibacterium stylophorae]|uniref:DUF2569 family protein n=1 Tax=Coralloluteibacterium stylophorae TaxID=1776034 RepID=A0A8J8AVZ3_9GAMM|nr:hypothetical protein [Coralloluteibacterium stylophorae]MBS7457357.1 hypothetical protein [Coralloluteibacterium stylophorae]